MARSSTIWAKDGQENGTYTRQKDKLGTYQWNNEVVNLYIKDADKAVLACTVMDEDVLKQDDCIGVAANRQKGESAEGVPHCARTGL